MSTRRGSRAALKLRKRWTRVARWIAVSATLALAALPAAGIAYADLNTGGFSHGSPPCSGDDRKDPITLIFYGWGYADRSANSVDYHFGWSNQEGEAQYYLSHDDCGTQTQQRADGGSSDTRYHIRIRKTYHDDSYWNITSQSTPHHEDYVYDPRCGFPGGHAVDRGGYYTGGTSGFVQGRERVIAGLNFREGHGFLGYQWRGNTAEIGQCDGDPAGNDGYVGFIQQHYSFH